MFTSFLLGGPATRAFRAWGVEIALQCTRFSPATLKIRRMVGLMFEGKRVGENDQLILILLSTVGKAVLLDLNLLGFKCGATGKLGYCLVYGVCDN